MKEIIILVGAPGSGKSTWRDKFVSDPRNADIVAISSDDLIEAHAAANGMTYSEAFQSQIKIADAVARASFEEAVKEGRSVVIDRTNMSRKARASFLSQVPDDYRKIAILFDTPRAIVEERLAERAARTGKTIPSFVMDSMYANYETPEYAEFDVIFSEPVQEYEAASF